MKVPPLPYSAPAGYYYEFEDFKKNVVSVWLCNTYKFVYNGGDLTRTIHSFYNTKTGKCYAPVNSKTMGKEVEFRNTRNYTAMQHKQTPLEQFFA